MLQASELWQCVGVVAITAILFVGVGFMVIFSLHVWGKVRGRFELPKEDVNSLMCLDCTPDKRDRKNDLPDDLGS